MNTKAPPKRKPRPCSPAQRARDEREAQRERIARALFHHHRNGEEPEAQAKASAQEQPA